MYQRLDSPAGVRFLASIREGHGLKPSARAAGVGKETGYRWLREAYLTFRGQGLNSQAAQHELGFSPTHVTEWERRFQEDDGRHHFQVAPDVETSFWCSYLGGATLGISCAAAGVSIATGYRWLYGRFVLLRLTIPAARVRKDLRLSQGTVAAWESRRKEHLVAEKARVRQVGREGILEARLYAERTAAPLSAAQERRALRLTRYWELVRSGASNAPGVQDVGREQKHRNPGFETSGQRRRQAGPWRCPPGGICPCGNDCRLPTCCGWGVPCVGSGGNSGGTRQRSKGAGPPPGRAGPLSASHGGPRCAPAASPA